jgi:integrase
MAKPKKPLTDRAVATAKPAPQGKRRLLWDAIVPGLALRVTDRGAKSFVLVTRYPGSANPTARALGTYGAISLEAARQRAREWLALIGAGVDPEVRESERQAQTFKAIATEYLARKAKDHRSRDWVEAALERLVYPALGAKPIDAIGRGDIVRLLDRIEDERGPVMANRTLSILNRVMNYHAARSDTFRSPIVRGMARGREEPRSRVLTDEELRAIWRATELNTMGAGATVAGSARGLQTASGSGTAPVFAALVRFILLTATRRNEAAKARRSEIADGEWTILAARYKTKLDHVVPLSALAIASIPPGDGEWLFTINGRDAIGNYTWHKTAFDQASGVTDWRLHDLRRTARSLMSRAGVPTDHAERCLGHVIGGVRGVYDRHEYYEEKRRAFEALAAQIERIVNPQENVVSIGRKR